MCCTMGLHGLQGHSLPHHGLLHGLQRNLSSATCNTFSCSFFTDLGACRVVSLTSAHSSLPATLTKVFIPFLNYIIPVALPLSLLCLALALASSSSVLEPAGSGPSRHGGIFWHLLAEASPAAFLLAKPCHANQTHLDFHFLFFVILRKISFQMKVLEKM